MTCRDVDISCRADRMNGFGWFLDQLYQSGLQPFMLSPADLGEIDLHTFKRVLKAKLNEVFGTVEEIRPTLVVKGTTNLEELLVLFHANRVGQIDKPWFILMKGLMGSGKTFFGKFIATTLGGIYLDQDMFSAKGSKNAKQQLKQEIDKYIKLCQQRQKICIIVIGRCNLSDDDRILYETDKAIPLGSRTIQVVMGQPDLATFILCACSVIHREDHVFKIDSDANLEVLRGRIGGWISYTQSIYGSEINLVLSEDAVPLEAGRSIRNVSFDELKDMPIPSRISMDQQIINVLERMISDANWGCY